jgi:hypothetical protein
MRSDLRHLAAAACALLPHVGAVICLIVSSDLRQYLFYDMSHVASRGPLHFLVAWGCLLFWMSTHSVIVFFAVRHGRLGVAAGGIVYMMFGYALSVYVFFVASVGW